MHCQDLDRFVHSAPFLAKVPKVTIEMTSNGLLLMSSLRALSDFFPYVRFLRFAAPVGLCPGKAPTSSIPRTIETYGNNWTFCIVTLVTVVYVPIGLPCPSLSDLRLSSDFHVFAPFGVNFPYALF